MNSSVVACMLDRGSVIDVGVPSRGTLTEVPEYHSVSTVATVVEWLTYSINIKLNINPITTSGTGKSTLGPRRSTEKL